MTSPDNATSRRVDLAPLRSLGRLARPHILFLALSTVLLALHALTAGAYAYLAGPVLKFVYSGGTSAGQRLGWLVDRLLPAGAPDVGSLTAAIALLVVVLVTVKGLAYIGGSYLVVVAGQRMEHQLRVALHDHLLAVLYVRLSDLPRGDMVSRFLADVAQVKVAVTHGLAHLVRDALQIVVLAALAVWLDPVLGLVALGVLPFSSATILRIGSRLRKRRRKVFDAYGDLASAVNETATALPVLRAFGAERQAKRNFDRLSTRVYHRNLRAWVLQILASPLMELLGALALAGTLWYAAGRIGSGALGAEEFVSFFAAIFMLYRPVKMMGETTSQIYGGLAALDRVEQILSVASEEPDEDGGRQLSAIESGLRFEDVSFSYGGSPALREVTFEIPAGSTVALVGASGSGKTTAALLLLRLVEPTRGRITVDGEDARSFSRHSLRRLFGLVTQEPVLLRDTIEANVLLGLDRSRGEVEKACRAAGAEAFVTALPRGYDTDVGEAGSRLSGGERQRICIARALLRDPPALVLDEATAAVDSATEAEIAAALEELMADRTTLLISHRLSTVKRADAVVVLQEGRVVDQGTPAELARRPGPFREVFRDQLPVE